MIFPRRTLRAAALLTVLGALGGLTACTSSSPAPRPTATAAPTSSTGAVPAGPLDYVSVGDSYAAGYQPAADGNGPGGTTRNGFAYQVVDKAKARGYDLRLVNFGCSGATTASATNTPGCAERRLGPGASGYREPQITAAVDYLRTHRGRVGLVSIVLGGNDITACADSTTTTEATSCVTSALGRITTSLTSITRRLRAAAGPDVRIVGLTYPDVFLGEARSADPQRQQLAQLSVTAFRSLVNPQLALAYKSGGASFADVTAATGAYSADAVDRVCALTYYCALRDIHPRTAGYALIADLVARQLPQR